MSMTKARGVTLIEMLITILVVAVLAAIGLPSFRDLLASTRVNAVTNDLASAILQTSTEAVRTRKAAKLCPRALSGTDVCATTADWANGWVIQVDRNGDNTLDAELALFKSPPPTSVTVSGPIQIEYNSIGAILIPTGVAGPTGLTFTITHVSPCRKKTVDFSALGNTTVSDLPC
jgi:prepilin-type N-terminal cleavage/methylation domain-containing protein